jgi:hypothetical protein
MRPGIVGDGKVTSPWTGSLCRRLALWIFHPDQQPLLRLAVSEVQQRRSFIRSQVRNAGFHNRRFLALDDPSGTLRFRVDHTFDGLTLIGFRVGHGPGDDTFFANGQLQENCRCRSGRLSVLGHRKHSQREPLGVVRRFRCTGGNRLRLLGIFLRRRYLLVPIIDRVAFVIHIVSITVNHRIVPCAWKPASDQRPRRPAVGAIPTPPRPVGVVLPEVVSRVVVVKLIANFVTTFVAIIDQLRSVFDTVRSIAYSVVSTVGAVINPVTGEIGTIVDIVRAVITAVTGEIGTIVHVVRAIASAIRALERLWIVQECRRCSACGNASCGTGSSAGTGSC